MNIYQTSDGSIFMRPETAQRQEALLDGIEAARQERKAHEKELAEILLMVAQVPQVVVSFGEPK